MSDEAAAHEIVIIKRARSEGEEPHHGGVWKIAFADFMTAMMAFFLVMWLISANDKTRATVARYFNPVQLVDSTPQPRGLNDPKAGSPSVAPKTKKPLAENEQKTGSAAPGDAKSDPRSEKPTQRDDAELFKDPYAVLAELAAKNSVAPMREPAQAPAEGAKGGAGAVGIRNGEAYRDPFEPLALGSDTTPDVADARTARTRPAGLSEAGHEAEPRPATASRDAKPSEAPIETPVGDAQVQAGALQTKIAALLKQGAGAGAVDGQPNIEVRHTEEGLVITLTDEGNFSMFASASAEPVPKMVGLMEKIGRMLKTEKGRVTIRGFTDNHPFKSDSYDNWRLSSARAHMAHYMLVRGGLDDARIDRIEGYADHRPKNVKDPGAAENRRIEILLREGSS